jgi:hypothetical protein
MMVRQLADHHLAFWQNALCDRELLKRAEQDDGLVQERAFSGDTLRTKELVWGARSWSR